jgi:hypothetical protein
LMNYGLVVTPGSVPVLRLPFWFSDPECDRIEGLRSEYKTVLVLPFRSESARRRVIKEWNATKDDPSILVFLQNILHVAWEGEECASQWHCQRPDERVTFSQNAENGQPPSTWLISQESESLGAAAVNLDGNGDPTATGKYPHPYSFFPIHKEHNPFPGMLLHHGQFPLDPSREFVRLEDEGTEAVVRNVSDAVQSILSRCSTLGAQLDLLKPRIPPNEMTGLERSLWASVRDKFIEMPVPGPTDRSVRSLRLFPDTFNLTHTIKLQTAFRASARWSHRPSVRNRTVGNSHP